MNDLYKMKVNTNLLYNGILHDNAEDITTQENALELLKVVNLKEIDIKAIKYIYDFYIEHIR